MVFNFGENGGGILKKTKWALIVVVGVLLAVGMYRSRYLELEEIEIVVDGLAPELEGFRIAHISDLHLPHSASIMDEILRRIEEAKPDIIVMTGDDIDDSYDFSQGYFEDFSHRIVKIADVYAVSGNHEVEGENYWRWRRTLESAGAVVLDDAYVHLDFLTLVGFKDRWVQEEDFVPDSDAFKIGLVHRPQYFQSDFNVVFAGHNHGGQVRLPGIGGLVAPAPEERRGPNLIFFPDHSSGLYLIRDGKWKVMSRGLGNQHPFRLNNPFHLPIITLRSQ